MKGAKRERNPLRDALESVEKKAKKQETRGKIREITRIIPPARGVNRGTRKNSRGGRSLKKLFLADGAKGQIINRGWQ